MPRSAPRPTQTPAAASGQAYGERKAQLDAQAALPLPQGAPPAPSPGGRAAAAPRVDPAAAALAAAQAMQPPTPPPWAAGPVDENIHAGLPTGPGPGPEVLGLQRPRRAPVADMLIAMARATGDPRFAEMAQRAQ